MRCLYEHVQAQLVNVLVHVFSCFVLMWMVSTSWLLDFTITKWRQ